MRTPQRLESLLRISADVEEPSADWCQQPLVAVGSVEVAAHAMEVHRQLTHRLTAVPQREDSAGPSQSADLLSRQQGARIGGDVTEADQPGAWRDGPFHPFQDHVLVVVQLDLLDDGPLPVGQPLNGLKRYRMLLAGDQHLVTRFPAQPPQHHDKAVAGAHGQGDLRRVGPEEVGDLRRDLRGGPCSSLHTSRWDSACHRPLAGSRR